MLLIRTSDLPWNTAYANQIKEIKENKNVNKSGVQNPLRRGGKKRPVPTGYSGGVTVRPNE